MWVALLVVGGLAVLAGCIYVLPQMLVPDRSAASLAAVPDRAKRLELEDARLKQRNDVRTTLLQGLAGAVVAVGLSLTWRQIRVSQEGQFYERFKDAIDQLGSDTLDVRLGGIFALERIAGDSERDHPTVVEVLSAFVREHSQPAIQRSPAGDDANDDPLQDPARPQPTTDVQAALTVLGRLPIRRGIPRGDLSGAHLHGASLGGGNLEGASLSGAHLQRASLDGAYLRGAYLSGTHLQRASLSGAFLDRAYLRRAHLEGAFLDGASLRGAHLEGAFLDGASLRRVHLEGASLGGNFGGASLSGAYLEGAFLDGASLRRVSLNGAHLEGASLRGAVADVGTAWPDAFDAASNGIEIYK